MEMKIILLMLLNILLNMVTADFTEYCPQECKCLWASGSKKADCSISNFSNIPKTFDSEIQILDLTGNKLKEITKHGFKKVGLINLKKLFLRENNLKTIHKNGFSGLDIMIELDLSRNELKTLNADTFKETLNIRWILLNSNQIEKLEDGLFNNLPFLQKVDLSDNKIVTLGLKTFMDVPKLNILKLGSNKLEHLNMEALNTISSLSFLDVHDNPWQCDCNLLPFRNWLISKQLYTLPIACSAPREVHGKLWKELDSSDFTCLPSSTQPFEKITIRPSDTTTKISCEVNGNTLPEVHWALTTQIKDGAYSYQGEIKYNLAQSSSDSKWVNLTINLCIFNNPEVDNEQHLTLSIAPTIPGVIMQ